MITGIYIENFKGIGEPGIKLDLEPVTLLFGNNSAGKSTIFHAILLAYEVLVRGNRNPDKTELGGSIVDLGGFANFVHQHELQRTVRLRFNLDLSSVSLDQEWRIYERVVEFDGTNVDIGKAGEDVWSASVLVDLTWDDYQGHPFVSKYSVELDEQLFAEIEDFRLVGGLVLMYVDPTHSVLSWPDEGRDDSLGVLDYLIPEMRTGVEELFCVGEYMSFQDVANMVAERDLNESSTDEDPDHVPLHSYEELAEDDPWDEDQEHLLDVISDSEDRYLNESDETDTNSEEVDYYHDFIIVLESLNNIPNANECEFRSANYQDESGKSFDPLLFRDRNGQIGVIAVEFYAPDRWQLQEASKAIGEWLDESGLTDDEAVREARTLMLNSEDALPSWFLPLDLQLSHLEIPEDDVKGDSIDSDFITELLSRLVIVPGRALMECLDACRYVGPLREIPSRQFSTPSTPDRSRWSTGLAAWDFLAQCSDEMLKEISQWLADENRIGTGHEIVRTKFRELPSHDLEIKRLEADDYLDDLERIREMILARPEVTKVQLRDSKLNVRIDPHDCAIGIAQLVPVVVAGVTAQPNREKPDQVGMFLIEQPELHNHPSVEVGLGDLFIETVHQKQCRFILETHGEHLMLRMLRRIRQTTDKELPDGVNGLLPDEIAVYYVERTREGVNIKRLRIDETGEFLDNWPKGFFDERAEELFG